MATLQAASNHNFTASSWATVDSTSLLVSNANNTTLTTSYVSSSTFTPGAITIDGIAVWVNTRPGSTGTISVALDQGGSDVAGTPVTINVSDIPSDGNCWVFFKFAAPVTLLAATAYSVKARTSSSSQVSLFRNATSNNWSRLLRTTTTAAPAAGDNLYVIGEKTGAGTGNTITVTMDNTASTILGLVDISSGGTLTYGTSASTAYLLKMAGVFTVRSGGSCFIGTPGGTTIPSTSTAELFLSNSSNVDFGIEVLGSGIFKTAGNNNANPWALLAADASASATSLTADRSTGWKNGDTIAIASTTRTNSECESKALTADASGTSLTITAITNAHGGNSSTLVQAELVNLTRNVKIHGTSTSLQAYFRADSATTVDLNDTELYNMGSGTSNKRGVDLNTTTGSFAATYCSFHDFVASSSTVRANSSNSNISFAHCVFYNMASECLSLDAATGAGVSVSDCVAIRSVNSHCFVLPSSATIATLRGAGGSKGILVQSGNATGSVGNLVAHSNSGAGVDFETVTGSSSGYSVGTVTSWRNGTDGLSFGGTLTNLSIGTVTIFGNANQGIFINAGIRNVSIVGGEVRAGATLTQTTGLTIQSGIDSLYLVNIVFGGGGQTHSSADINVSSSSLRLEWVLLDNCALSSSTQISGPSNILAPTSLPQWAIRANFLGQTQNHKTWFGNGTWTYDTVIADASPSLRMTPTSATIKLQSPGFKAAVPSGQAATVSLKVRKSVSGDGAAYNGNQPRLSVRRNYGAGITSDTVLDTATAAADGAFETLTGTTSAVTGNCALEFFVDCDGTAGWVNVDTWTVTTA